MRVVRYECHKWWQPTMTKTVTNLMGDALQHSRLVHLAVKYDQQLTIIDLFATDEKTTQGEAIVALLKVVSRRICMIAECNDIPR